MQKSTAMTAQIFSKAVAVVAVPVAVKKINCYHDEYPQRKAFMALGSSCSSSFNFSADFRNVCMGFVTGHGY